MAGAWRKVGTMVGHGPLSDASRAADTARSICSRPASAARPTGVPSCGDTRSRKVGFVGATRRTPSKSCGCSTPQGRAYARRVRGLGADFMPEFKQYIKDSNTIIASQHKLYGPQSNDLMLQLRKQGIDKLF